MIALAGGTYVPQGLAGNENALSTMNMQMESFYAAARDADYIIYNSTIDGELDSLDQLLDKSSLLADFKAVKEEMCGARKKPVPGNHGAGGYDSGYPPDIDREGAGGIKVYAPAALGGV
ncbi:MAG: hypothetical protein ACLR0U_08320 [Enterocloster clostridioformis]